MDKIDRIDIWYDNAWPHLEVVWRTAEGYFAPTMNDNVDVRIDSKGNSCGFLITGIRNLRGKAFTVDLSPATVNSEPGTP